MRLKSSLIVVASLIMVLGGCGSRPPPAPAVAVSAVPSRDSLRKVVDRYWDERVVTDELIAPQRLADALSVERRYLLEVDGFNRDTLDPESRLTFDIFKRQRQINAEGFTYPEELLPLKPFGGPQQTLADAETLSAQSTLSKAEVEAWLRRSGAYVSWARQAIVNMKEGVRRGYTMPRAVVERVLAQLERLGSESLPMGLPSTANADVQSATLALRDYLKHEYLAQARPGLALTELPLGRAWYQHRVRRATGAEVTPLELNRIGAAEVERLHSRMTALAPPSPAGADAGDLLAAYAQLELEVTSKLEGLFAGSTPAQLTYLLSDREEDPGSPVYYLPPHTLFVLAHSASNKPAIASFLQQALPGYHFQQSLQRSQSLPKFRRFDAEPAYVAGWGLYAATLGEELGLYPDDAGKYQLLSLQMSCALGLVVDTGIHSMGWTRTRALDYLHEHLNMDEAEAQARVDSYAAAPGDALACTTGELKFQSIRARAQQALGARFDIREFHSQILKDGAMPLDMLDAKLKSWLEVAR